MIIIRLRKYYYRVYIETARSYKANIFVCCRLGVHVALRYKVNTCAWSLIVQHIVLFVSSNASICCIRIVRVAPDYLGVTINPQLPDLIVANGSADFLSSHLHMAYISSEYGLTVALDQVTCDMFCVFSRPWL